MSVNFGDTSSLFSVDTSASSSPGGGGGVVYTINEATWACAVPRGVVFEPLVRNWEDFDILVRSWILFSTKLRQC